MINILGKNKRKKAQVAIELDKAISKVSCSIVNKQFDDVKIIRKDGTVQTLGEAKHRYALKVVPEKQADVAIVKTDSVEIEKSTAIAVVKSKDDVGLEQFNGNNEVGLMEVNKVNKGLNQRIKNKLDRVRENQRLECARRNLIEEWNSIMFQSKKYNSNFDTFEIVGEAETAYGWSFRIYTPDGLSFNELDNIKCTIENNMGCTFMYIVHSSNKYADCNIIYEHLVHCNSIPFEPIKVKPYEFCPGLRITGEPIIIDVNISPHILLAGQSRKGKNGAFDMAMLSWINSCSEKEVEFYLFQCAKIDLIKYSRCKQVKCFVKCDFFQMLEAVRYIVDVEIPRRLDLFEEMYKTTDGENVFDYNLEHPDNPLTYIYVVMDEFLALMLQSKAKQDENDAKNEILAHVQTIGQMGAAVGIQYVVLHQKPEKALCPSFIKNMSSIRVCFGFDDESCGRIVLGEKDGGKVLNLPPRRAYINNNGLLELLYTTNLRARRKMYINPHVDDNKVDFFKQISEGYMEGLLGDSKVADVEGMDIQEKCIKQDSGTAPLPSKRSKKIKEDSLPDEYTHEAIIEEYDDGSINNGTVVTREQAKEIKKEAKKAKEEIVEVTEEAKEVKEETKEVKEEIVEVKEEAKVVKEEIVEVKEETVEVKEVKKETKLITNGQINMDGINIEELQSDIEAIVASNAKKNEGWVPYEAKEGDKVVDIKTIRAAKFYSAK